MKIEFNPANVANLLKAIVNQQFADGFLWYPNVGEMPTLFDINEAIRILESAEIKTIEVMNK